MTETLVNFLQKIVLGTAQFGMDYGIANVSGQPTKSEVFKILEMAWHHGIRIFDTAPGYESEVLLGEFITVHGLEKDAILLTKISDKTCLKSEKFLPEKLSIDFSKEVPAKLE